MTRSNSGRWVILLLCVLAASLWIAAQVELEGSPPAERPLPRWVRTVDGWEIPRWLERHAADRSIHPVLVGTFIAMASTLALLALPPRPR